MGNVRGYARMLKLSIDITSDLSALNISDKATFFFINELILLIVCLISLTTSLIGQL